MAKGPLQIEQHAHIASQVARADRMKRAISMQNRASKLEPFLEPCAIFIWNRSQDQREEFSEISMVGVTRFVVYRGFRWTRASSSA